MSREVQLEPGWQAALGDEFECDYMRRLATFLRAEKSAGKVIYPPGREIFNALNRTPPEQVRVVILGQDPYHGPNQAHGLSFSVPRGVSAPPSLQNIFKELVSDIGTEPPGHGCLEDWARQGVLLLNSVLTVEQGQPGSHQNRGWERFTDKVVATINANSRNTVFLLWGAYAQKKGQVIDRNRHLVLQAPHPSPLSAYRGFLGCRHFSKSNEYLEQHGYAAIDWQLH